MTMRRRATGGRRSTAPSRGRSRPPVHRRCIRARRSRRAGGSFWPGGGRGRGSRCGVRAHGWYLCAVCERRWPHKPRTLPWSPVPGRRQWAAVPADCLQPCHRANAASKTRRNGGAGAQLRGEVLFASFAGGIVA
eukprot:scaffold2527_cov337-Prasinococcus_capsulatus_cf.AAC.12